MAERLDRHRLLQAFHRLGEHLAEGGAFVELAVYGGSAIMLQFDWRQATEDVDAVVREGYDEAVLDRSVKQVAVEFGLDADWLNNAVGMFTPLAEDGTMFDVAGCYPASNPGLRILLAKPHYLLAMKLQALRSIERGDRDLSDARALAKHLGITDDDALRRLYVSIHGEQPTTESLIRFPAVLER